MRCPSGGWIYQPQSQTKPQLEVGFWFDSVVVHLQLRKSVFTGGKVDNHLTKLNYCVLVFRQPVSKLAISFLKLNEISLSKLHIPRKKTIVDLLNGHVRILIHKNQF